jgi:hypothetical protein
MSNTADVTDGKPIAVRSQFNAGANAINPLVTFYDIHERKREMVFLYFVPDRHFSKNYLKLATLKVSQY